MRYADMISATLVTCTGIAYVIAVSLTRSIMDYALEIHIYPSFTASKLCTEMIKRTRNTSFIGSDLLGMYLGNTC